MLTKAEIRKGIMLSLNRAGGQMSESADTLVRKFGAGYAEVVDDLVRLGKLKANYTTTQGITGALHYMQLTPLGRLEADEAALEAVATDMSTGALEAVRASIDKSTAKPFVLVFEDGSIARIGCSNSEAITALLKATVKQAML